MSILYPNMSLSPIVRWIVCDPSLFCIVDVGETKMTNPIRSAMELRGLVWMSWIDLKWNQIKGINGYSSNDGWMVEEDPRKISI